MLLFIYRFLCGYLHIKIVSKHPEKIINLCGEKALNIWGTTIKNGILYMKIGIKSFRLLRLLKRGVSARLQITKKIGLPFFIKRYKKRYGLAVGAAMFFGFLWFMSGFIWNISVVGNEKLSRDEVLKYLSNVGIYEGARINSFDVKEKRNELLLKNSKLSWAAFNLEGSKLTVEVKETRKTNKPENSPSNLVSGFDGIVKSVEILKGSAAVKVGDAVSKGDLLVSGFLEYDDGSTDVVRSRGSVVAEVSKEFTVSQPIRVTESVKTGEIKTRSVLSLFSINIPLYIGDVKGEYIKTTENGENENYDSYIPIKITTSKYELTKEKTYNLSESEIKARLNKKMDNSISGSLGDYSLIKRNEHFYKEGDKFILKVKINCLKNIVFEEKILLDTRN